MNYQLPMCISHKPANTGDVRLSFVAGAHSARMWFDRQTTYANGGDSLMT